MTAIKIMARMNMPSAMRSLRCPRSNRHHPSFLQAGQGILDKIFSISEVVKARIVRVRMLPSISADSNTLAAVSSSGASKMHTWSY
jgi:hypothetical protein